MYMYVLCRYEYTSYRTSNGITRITHWAVRAPDHEHFNTVSPIHVLPGLRNTTLYTTYGLFHLHICQVCGSFQCPYCPFYNSAPPLCSLKLLVAAVWLCATWMPIFETITIWNDSGVYDMTVTYWVLVLHTHLTTSTCRHSNLSRHSNAPI